MQHLKLIKKHNRNTFFPRKWLHPLLTFSQRKTLQSRSFWGVKVLFVNRFSIVLAIFTTFGKQKDDKNTPFPGGVSVKYWNDLLGLAKGKRNSTPTHNCI